MKRETYKIPKLVIWIIIIIIALIAIISGSLASSIIIMVPFVILFFLIEIFLKSEILRKIAWIAYAIITCALLIQNYNSGENSQYILSIAVICLSITALLLDKGIQKMLGKN